MKSVLWIPVSCALALVLSNCGNSGGDAGLGATTGPFDSRGNYVEEWADNPSKWRKSGGSPSPHESRTDDLPEVVLNDQPPQNSVPLVPSNTNSPSPIINRTTVRTPPKVAANSPRVISKPQPTGVKAKAKPKPVLVKAQPKPKPKAARYVVKKGDSLSAIASRTGSSISAIRSANGISGSIIRPGQSLTIPKH